MEKSKYQVLLYYKYVYIEDPMKEFCNKIAWIEGGKLKQFGEINEVLSNYEDFLHNFNDSSEQVQKAIKENINKVRIQ